MKLNLKRGSSGGGPMDEVTSTQNGSSSSEKCVFLGGTCNNSTWREDQVIPRLRIIYFNPVVPDWNDEAYKRELEARESCDICLYVITPKISGFYAIAETIDDSNKRPEKTIFCFLEEDGKDKFDETQIKSLKAVGKMVEDNGGKWFETIDDAISYMNSEKE